MLDFSEISFHNGSDRSLDWWQLEALGSGDRCGGGGRRQNLKQHLFNVLEKFNLLSKVFCITSDNASTNGTIATCLEQRCIIPGFTRSDNMLGCMAHVINLIANAGIRLLRTFDHHFTQNIQINIILCPQMWYLRTKIEKLKMVTF